MGSGIHFKLYICGLKKRVISDFKTIGINLYTCLFLCSNYSLYNKERIRIYDNTGVYR